MTELGYATLPRGRRLTVIPTLFHNHNNGHLPNGHHLPTPTTNHLLPHVPKLALNGGLVNGYVGANECAGGRAVHDGFATVRSGGGKRGRARSSPSMTSDVRTTSCHHGCCNSGARTWAMEPLWEEKGVVESSEVLPISRRDRSQLPWWEVATRRSRYRSCPAFSQASVVSALEQTMSNVTDRLERLASSPDLKETEAAELRKTAAVLRQQSSAVCQSVNSGYFSMERQLSCDSVSSVTSTVSGASMSSYASIGSRSLSATHMQHCNPHNLSHTQPDSLNPPSQAKLKKRSWLRSSFRRAFGRHGRKRSKQMNEGSPEETSQELPLHHTVNSAVRHLPPPPPSSQSTIVQQQHQHIISLQDKESHQKQQPQQKEQGASEESELLARLQEEATDKERALTDCRLEVLSAQHQLQAQADMIAKLQAEVTGLREENMQLVSLVRGQYGPSADVLLAPLTHTLTALTLSHTSITGGNTSPREDGRHVKVVVVNQPELTSVHAAATVTLDSNHLTHIGNIHVESKTTWEELDTMIKNSLKDYGNRVDPVSALGLDVDSILCYRVENVVRASNLSRPELLPYGYCVGDVDALHVWLKGGNQKKDGESISNVSAASFTSVTPATSLKRLASLLVEHRRLVLAGPPASGKSFLAHTLAQFFVVNSGRDLSEDAIKTFRVNGSNSLELCQLLSSLWPRGLTSSGRSASSISSTNSSGISVSSVSSDTSSVENTPPSVIILDDLHAASGVVETLQRCLPVAVHTGPAIIATCCPTAALSTRLHIHCNFRWAALSPQQEPVRGLLGRVLRRRVVAAEVAVNTRLPDAHHLAEWLTRLWLHLNTVLSGHCGSHEVGIGPGLLMDCPLGQEETQAWFTEVWNTRLVPFIVKTLRVSTSANPGLLDTWTDPIDWILATYPWPNNAACGSDQLKRIPASDIGQQDASLPVTGTVPTRHTNAPLSARQQVHKSESVYAVPQLLPQIPILTRGTGQSVLTAERSNKTCLSNQIETSYNTNSENTANDMQVIYSNLSSESRAMAAVVRERSDSNASSSLIKAPVSINMNSTSGNQTVITANKDKNQRASTFLGGRINNDGNHLTFQKHDSKPVTSAEIRNNTKYINEDELQVTNDENELMESDTIMTRLDEKFQEYSVQNQNRFIDTTVSNKPDDPIHYTVNAGNKDVAMETECKPQLFDIKSQSLDILAKNAINANGLAPECVKIIHTVGPKIDLKGIAQELTTTFKPVESAM